MLMNNGAAIVARALRTVRRDHIQIEGFQIVNGCQTTHLLYDQREKADPSIYIPLRVIATQDEDVVRSISRGTNRQTKCG
ncbi:MAG: AIPR family protein [Rhodospirillales bacterium]|nr:AIPR family protein [Rhodospirillales bacterium]